MGRIEFKVGEAFPHDDPVARWVATLSIIANDLARVNRRLYEIMQLGSEVERQGSVYWTLLAASHLREAIKFLDPDYCALTDAPEVKAFMERRADETRERLEAIRDEFTPWKGSWPHQLTKPTRDRLFHYASDKKSSEDYGEEVGSALHEMRDEDSHIDIGGRNLDWQSWFGTEVRLNWVGQAGELSESDYGELIDSTNELCGRITDFASRITLAYLQERVGIGQDAATLGVYVPTPGSEITDRIWDGSGIVGSLVGDSGRIRIDFEGDDEVFPTYEDRVERAAERHLAVRPGGYRGYPSQASAIVDADQVMKVGWWDPVAGELEITDREALAKWRDSCGEWRA